MKVDPGDQAQRVLAGEIGLGAAIVKVDGQLIDAKTGEIILKLTDTRSKTGSWALRNMTTEDSGPGLVADILDAIAGAIISEVSSIAEDTYKIS